MHSPLYPVRDARDRLLNGARGNSQTRCRNHRTADRRGSIAGCFPVLLLFLTVPGEAFQPAVPAVGFVVASREMSVSGEPAQRGQTILSGDTVAVAHGEAEIDLGNGTRIALGQNTQISFERRPNHTIANLERGGASFFHPGDAPGIVLQVGTVSVRPTGGWPVQADVGITQKGLLIGSRQGSVQVEGTGPALEVTKDKAIRITAETGLPHDASMGSPTGGGSGSARAPGSIARLTRWRRVEWCSLAGAAVGSIPLLVSESRSASPNTALATLIPAGGVGAGLTCWTIPAPARCTLTAQPAVVNLGDPVTLTWTSPQGYTGYLSDVGIEPSSGSARVLPMHDGENVWELKADGPKGTLVCDATVVAKAPQKPPPLKCQLWYTIDPKTRQTVVHWSSENATSGVLQGLTIPDLTQAKDEKWELGEKPVLGGDRDVGSEQSRYYRLTVSAKDQRDSTCNVTVRIPTCDDFKATRTAPPSNGFKLSWKWQDVGQGWTLEPKPYKLDQTNYLSGSAYVYPKEDTTYTLTVSRKLPVDSRNPKGDTVEFTNTCEADADPVSCTLSVDPTQVDATAKKPAKVTLKWDGQHAKSAVLKTYVNGKEVKSEPDPAKELEKDVAQTTEYALTVKGEHGEVTVCRACVLNRPENGKVLNIPPVFQKNPMWCWLTVGQMIFQYYGVPSLNPWALIRRQPPANLNPDKRYQWGIIAMMYPGCWEHPDSCPLSGGGSWENVQQMLQKYPPEAGKQAKQQLGPINSTFTSGCLTAAAIKKEIDAGRPIMVGISPGGNPAAEGLTVKQTPVAQHVALIIGYQEKDGKLQVIINDPWPYRLRPRDPNPYLKAGGAQNCDTNYTLGLDDFCKKLGWQGSFIDIKK